MNTNESTAIEFKMKAECDSDLRQIKALVRPWLRYWQAEHITIEHDGQHYPLPEVEVEFGLNPGGPSLGELQFLIDALDDCHVAAETVARARDYTGNRVALDVTDSLPTVPARERMKAILGSIRAQLNCQRLEEKRSERAIHALSLAASNKRVIKDPRGFIAMVTHKPTGLTSMRRISAPHGFKGRGDPVQERLVLLAN